MAIRQKIIKPAALNREIPAEKLIGPELSTFSSRYAFKNKQVKIYLNNQSGPVRVSGGMYGSQVIKSIPFNRDLRLFSERFVAELGKKIGLSFSFVASPKEANIRIFLDRNIDLDDSGATVGIALSNQVKSGDFWEIFLSADLLNDPDFLKFAFVHEFGHTLGLEHPFDASDGDFYLSLDAWSGADVTETAMAYYSRNGSYKVTDFTPNDLKALQRLWGAKTPSSAPAAVAAAPRPSTATTQPVASKSGPSKPATPLNNGNRPMALRPNPSGLRDLITGQGQHVRPRLAGREVARPLRAHSGQVGSPALRRIDWMAQQPLSAPESWIQQLHGCDRNANPLLSSPLASGQPPLLA